MAAIIAYSRPFVVSRSEKSKNAAATISVKGLHLEGEAKDLHKAIREIRNEALAHSEYARYPVKIVNRGDTGFLLSASRFNILSQPISRRLFKKLCKLMSKHCESRLFSLNREMNRRGI